MSIKSKLLKHLSGADFEPYYWDELFDEEKSRAKKLAAAYLFSAFTVAACTVTVTYEIQTTPDGCSPVLFPEQTLIQQPQYCRDNRPAFTQWVKNSIDFTAN
ncbi:MAG: hypothetical protein AAF988_03825 [Pseudomonadota bacterium]